jgi:membrane protease YdiL (CAAX protease family)
MRAWIRQHRVAVFLAVTFAVTWGAWISLGLTGHRVGLGVSPVYLVGMFGPAIGAVTTLAICEGADGMRGLRRRLGRIRVGGRYWLAALGLPVGIFALVYLALVAYSMFLLAPIAVPTRQTITQVAGLPASGLFGVCALLFAMALGEEIGWRGFLQQELLRRHSPVVASVLVAACWAPWHAPLFFISIGYRTMPLPMIALWVVALVGLAIVLGWLYARGRHSILLVAAAHAAFNLTTASAGARSIAVIETIAVMVLAAWIARHERIASQRASLRLIPFVSAMTERRTP